MAAQCYDFASFSHRQLYDMIHGVSIVDGKGCFAARRRREHGALGRRRRARYVVSFYDTSTGRWQFTRRPSPDGRPWSTLAPADHQRLTHAVAEPMSHLDDAPRPAW
ncbi:ESX secretion-associated protein EspG [Gandjariella thermophila]|uniref:Uncharacterized protein n=1 Tax=Gandjariella thermophila TaxID=1931992 RepID=A0A4D4J4S7_9PSEU|nr:ESX secretion-associated protein EspG [Gandjariella thermophila]GDY30464.1 hypothetical protein GTS_20970 [Gandjariella thermophila]